MPLPDQTGFTCFRTSQCKGRWDREIKRAWWFQRSSPERRNSARVPSGLQLVAWLCFPSVPAIAVLSSKIPFQEVNDEHFQIEQTPLVRPLGTITAINIMIEHRANLDLGEHLKTGHALSLENRPTEPIQNKDSYTASRALVQICPVIGSMKTVHLRQLPGGYGNAGMRPERRCRSRNGGATDEVAP